MGRGRPAGRRQGELTPGLTRRVAEFSATLGYEDLPPPVVAHVKRIVLDSLGTALAASTLGAGCAEVVALARSLGGNAESTILGSSAKVSALHAAFANGALTHALNYDPIGPEVGHVGVACLPAVLAVAQRQRLSGKEFITAAAVAAEVTARVTAAIARTGRRPSERFLAGQLLGYFGAAAGAASALRLPPEQAHSALGLALMQASGSMQVVLSGDPPAKAIYGAFPNFGGTQAALLAQAGISAEVQALEGKAGLYGLIYDGEYRHEALVDGLGKDFLLLGTAFKPWPTSVILHPFLEAASRLAGADVGEVREVCVTGDRHIEPWCEPLAERRRPSNPAAAANSVPFGVAKMLCHGDVSLGDFTGEGLRDERALAVAAATRYKLDESVRGAVVSIVTCDGRTLHAEVEHPLGHPTRPVPDTRLETKFRDCCRYAASPVDAGALLEKLRRLELLPEAAALVTG